MATNNKNGSETKAININKPPKSAFTTSSTYEHNKMYNHNNNNNINNNINMVPTISVTPHSPGTKYNSILGLLLNSLCMFFVLFFNKFSIILFNLEDTLNHLQNIRESVVQIKNASVRSQHYATSNLMNPSVNHFFFFLRIFFKLLLYTNN